MSNRSGDYSDTFETLLHDPLSITDNIIKELILNKAVDFRKLRNLLLRIYDINEDQLLKVSNPNTGMLGKLNAESTKQRNNEFFRRVDSQKNNSKYYKIYCEGDSWFQFPIFVTDIIDHLNKNKDFLIYSDAYGGDWITNIIYEEQYVTALSLYSPEFFLISGGGNDLVGNHRIAIMVDKNNNYVKQKYYNKDEILNDLLSDGEKQSILNVQKYINKEFYATLKVIELEYRLLFERLYNQQSTKKNTIIITQGYDYAIPSPDIRFDIKDILQPLVNKFLDTGNWLYTPLMVKGILDRKLQKDTIFYFIYEFNELLVKLAEEYSHVYHIDNRGLARNINDWYDELHYKGPVFKKVAHAYELVIRNMGNTKLPKIIRTKDINKIKEELT